MCLQNEYPLPIRLLLLLSIIINVVNLQSEPVPPSVGRDGTREDVQRPETFRFHRYSEVQQFSLFPAVPFRHRGIHLPRVFRCQRSDVLLG